MKSNQLNYIIIYLLLFFLIGCSSTNEDIIDQVEVEEKQTESVKLEDKRFFINQVIEGKNVDREVILRVPINFDTLRNYPIVFAFHGRGTDNDTWINKLNHLMALGEFVGVYPQGYEKMWNSGGNESSKADDVAFVGDIIDELKEYKNLDFERIYAIGTSNGSSMTNKLALETSYFSAVASIVSQLSKANLPNDSTNPTSVFQINGANDTTIPINGGSKLGYVFLEAFESAKSWASAFECENFQLQNLGEDILYIFPNCLEGNEIRYLRIERGEHNLHWGRPELFVTVWDFLKRF